jgi:hypothetical protein
MHFIIEGFIYGVFNLFKVAPSNAGASEWTGAAILRTTSIFFHLVGVTMRAFDLFEG